ncbi:MAG: ribosomal L7Ae/L30e/S12e/Gadd45 family protein [Candidatus Woesearchaeota archaeon]
MAKKELNIYDEIRKNNENGKAILGLERTIKELKKSNLSKVYISSNCAKDVIEDLEYYASLQSIELIKLEIPNDELGIICKKPFSVSVLGILK